MSDKLAEPPQRQPRGPQGIDYLTGPDGVFCVYERGHSDLSDFRSRALDWYMVESWYGGFPKPEQNPAEMERWNEARTEMEDTMEQAHHCWWRWINVKPEWAEGESDLSWAAAEGIKRVAYAAVPHARGAFAVTSLAIDGCPCRG